MKSSELYNFLEIAEIFKKFQNHKKLPIFQNCKNLQKSETLAIFEKWPKLDKFSEITDIFEKFRNREKSPIFQNFLNLQKNL